MTKIARRDALIAEHREWAIGIARQIAGMLPTWFTVDDLTGPAEVALVKMAGKYDARLAVPFRAYAQRRIYGACFDSVRRKEYQERAHEPLEGHDPLSCLPSPEELAAMSECVEVWGRVQRLPPRHTLVVLAMYAGDMSQVEIAQLAGVTPSRVCQIHREALQMLRRTCCDLEAA